MTQERSASSREIGLADVIRQVKRELLGPESRRGDPAPLFAVDEVEVEIAFTVSHGVDGKLDLKVVSLGGDITQEDVQTVRVLLRPLQSGDEILAELRERDPELVKRITDNAMRTLKGDPAGESPAHWP